MFVVLPDNSSTFQFDMVDITNYQQTNDGLDFSYRRHSVLMLKCKSAGEAREYFDKITSAIEEGIPLVRL